FRGNESVIIIKNIYKKNFGLQNFIKILFGSSISYSLSEYQYFFVYNLAHFFLEKSMSKLNKDVLFLLFEELQDDSKSLFSCLLVNRLWCETVVLVLWRNPWYYDISYQNKSSLFNIVTSLLPDDIKEILTAQGILTTSQQPLLFDYLSFCRSMNVNVINDIIGSFSAYDRFL